MTSKTSMFRVQSLIASCSALALFTACGDSLDTTQNSQTKIVNGSRVTANEYTPERMGTVSLGGCTASVIAKDLVLTAAHCAGTIRGRVGFLVPGNRGRNVRVDGVIVHPGYRSRPRPEVDLAMIKLRENIPATHRVMPLLFDPRAADRAEPATQAGYGSTRDGAGRQTDRGRFLRRADTVITAHQITNRGGVISTRNGNTVNGGTAACSGDSGGPLYVLAGNTWYTAGVASTANAGPSSRPGSLNCSGGNQYASIAGNREWIIDTARRLTDGRRNTFDDAGLAFNVSALTPESPAPETDPLFQFSLDSAERIVTYSMKNVTGAPVNGCSFFLDVKRTNSEPYRLTVRTSETFAIDEEFTLQFDDSRESFSFYYGERSEEPTLSKDCG